MTLFKGKGEKGPNVVNKLVFKNDVKQLERMVEVNENLVRTADR